MERFHPSLNAVLATAVTLAAVSVLGTPASAQSSQSSDTNAGNAGEKGTQISRKGSAPILTGPAANFTGAVQVSAPYGEPAGLAFVDRRSRSSLARGARGTGIRSVRR